MVVESESNK